MKQLISALALSAMALSAQAATTTYSDYDDWSDNVSGIFTVETFNNYDYSGGGSQFVYLNPSVNYSGITYAADNALIAGISKNYGGDAAYLKSNYLAWGNGSPNTLKIDLGGTSNAFSMKIGDYQGSVGSYFVELSNGDTFTVAGNNAFTFFGAITTSAFSSIKITGATGVSIDNFGYGAVTPVPEPETYAMLLGGLALMGVIARRRSKQV